MNDIDFERRRPEVVKLIEDWFKTNNLLKSNEQLKVTFSVTEIPAVVVRVHNGEILPKDELLALHVETFLDLCDGLDKSKRTKISTVFNHSGLVYVGQVVRLTEEKMIKFRGVGKKRVEFIREVLEQKDLSFGLGSLPMGPLERAAIESYKTEWCYLYRIGHRSDYLLERFETIGEIARSSKSDLIDRLRTLPSRARWDDDYYRLGELAQVMRDFHLQGEFERE